MNLKINTIALGISQNKFTGVELDHAWADLYEMVKSNVKHVINSYGSKYSQMYNIEKEAFEEAFDMAIFKAVEKYDINKGDFTARVMTIGQNLCKNVLRDSKADVRKALTEAMSLNVSINNDGDEAVTFQDQLVDPASEVDIQVDEAEVESDIVKHLDKYSKLGVKKEREVALIKIYMAHSNDKERQEALLNFVGHDVKWATVRKQVSRARDNFKKYLMEEGAM